MLAGQDLLHHLQLITAGFGQHKAPSTADPPTEPAVDHHWQGLSACTRGGGDQKHQQLWKTATRLPIQRVFTKS